MTWILETHRKAWLVFQAALLAIAIVLNSWWALLFFCGLIMGAWFNPGKAVPLGSKTKWAITLIAPTIILLILIADDGSSNLKVELSRSGFMTIKNVGTLPLRIEDISINERPECKPKLGLLGMNVFAGPADLKVGDFLILSSGCSVVRATIRTDKRSLTYHFN